MLRHGSSPGGIRRGGGHERPGWRYRTKNGCGGCRKGPGWRRTGSGAVFLSRCVVYAGARVHGPGGTAEAGSDSYDSGHAAPAGGQGLEKKLAEIDEEALSPHAARAGGYFVPISGAGCVSTTVRARKDTCARWSEAAISTRKIQYGHAGVAAAGVEHQTVVWLAAFQNGLTPSREVDSGSRCTTAWAGRGRRRISRRTSRVP